MAKRKKKETEEVLSENPVHKITDLEARLLLSESDHMIDDHGYAIVGSRDRKPIHLAKIPHTRY